MASRDVERIKASANAYGVRGPTHVGEYMLCCPFCPERRHKEDTKFKLNLRPQAGKKGKVFGPWYCYACAAKGGGDLSWLGPGMVADPNAPKPGDWSEPPEGFARLDTKSIVLKPFIDYLDKRGVLEQAKAVGAGACIKGKYGGRVVIPLKKAGVWVGFSARAIWPGIEPKYRYPAGMDRKGSLWGADWVPHLKDKQAPLYLVEGVFDALPLYPFGIASFGKNVTDEQLTMLVGLGHPIIVALDGDAWVECRNVAARLALREADVQWARLPPGEDPGTLKFDLSKYVQPL